MFSAFQSVLHFVNKIMQTFCRKNEIAICVETNFPDVIDALNLWFPSSVTFIETKNCISYSSLTLVFLLINSRKREQIIKHCLYICLFIHDVFKLLHLNKWNWRGKFRLNRFQRTNGATVHSGFGNVSINVFMHVLLMLFLQKEQQVKK